MVKVGDYVKFTGRGYRRAIAYGYERLFGEKKFKVLEIRTSCCNRFLILDGVDGMYGEKFFSKVAHTKDENCVDNKNKCLHNSPGTQYTYNYRGADNGQGTAPDRAQSRMIKK